MRPKLKVRKPRAKGLSSPLAEMKNSACISHDTQSPITIELSINNGMIRINKKVILTVGRNHAAFAVTALDA